MQTRSSSRHALMAWGLHTLGPVVMGSALYVGWRETNLWFWRWGQTIGGESALIGLRVVLSQTFRTPPAWVRFSVGDALWVYALTWGLLRLLTTASRAERVVAFTACVALGPGAELAQAVGWVPGVFDPLDLGLSLLALAWAALVSSRWSGNHGK